MILRDLHKVSITHVVVGHRHLQVGEVVQVIVGGNVLAPAETNVSMIGLIDATSLLGVALGIVTVVTIGSAVLTVIPVTVGM